ncbi:MAG: enoyl-CoA hydratase/isomerase family protein [Candidatus Eremiobacteraeota bacterium]|nr:enoyl-CoA hydratase/isomerase family protein [Candidatus Eremiobacteraeota bacterium]
MEGTLTAEHRVEAADGVATITLDRPQQYNALTATLLEALHVTFANLERDAGVRAIVLTGEGKGFCAGQSLDDPALVHGAVGGKIDIFRAVAVRYNPLLRKILTIEKPVIAAVNGVAAGAGMGLALACDLRVASEEASFTTAFVRIGLVPDSGLSFLLPRMIGFGRALEAILLSDKIEAPRALELGLVSRVCPAAELASEAKSLASRLAQGPRALGLVKRELARNALGDLDEALRYEAEIQAVAAETNDFMEGLAAFREKRPARFSGR